MDKQTEAVLAWYLDFTRSPTRNREQRTADFYRLRALSFLETGVAMLRDRPDVLMVATQPVIIEHNGCHYKIGSFILFLQRKQNSDNEAVTVNFRFKNVTGAIESGIGSKVHHPHIIQSTYHDLSFPTGRLCIRQGQHTIYQALREGRIPEAVMFLEKVLHTHTPKFQTYAPITSWPKLET